MHGAVHALHCLFDKMLAYSGSKEYKNSCSAQKMSMKFNCSFKAKMFDFFLLLDPVVVFILLINVKMPSMVAILTFMSMINFMLN